MNLEILIRLQTEYVPPTCANTSKHNSTIYTYDINLPAGPAATGYTLYAGDYIQFEGINTYAQWYITENTCNGILN